MALNLSKSAAMTISNPKHIAVSEYISSHCQVVKFSIAKKPHTILVFHNLSFLTCWTIWVLSQFDFFSQIEFYHNLSFVNFFSIVQIWVLSYIELYHNLSFVTIWVLSQFAFWFVTIWFVSQFECCLILIFLYFDFSKI